MSQKVKRELERKRWAKTQKWRAPANGKGHTYGKGEEEQGEEWCLFHRGKITMCKYSLKEANKKVCLTVRGSKLV